VENLSLNNCTVLNNTSVQGKAALTHRDVLEIGGRLVRWEYLPQSPFFTASNFKVDTPTKRDVAVKAATPARVSSTKKGSGSANSKTIKGKSYWSLTSLAWKLLIDS